MFKASRIIAKCRAALAALAITASACMPAFPTVVSADTGTWVDGAMPVLTTQDSIAGTQMPVSCFPSTITYWSYTNADNSYNSIPREATRGVCMRSNTIGKYAAPLYSDPSVQIYEPYAYEFVVPGNGFAYRVVDGNGYSQGVVPVPGQPSYFVLKSDGNNIGGSYMYFYDSFSSLGSYEPIYTRPASVTEMAVKLRTPLSGQLKDARGMGLSLRDTHYAFSDNGQWMIAEVDGVGIVRINTQTKQTHLVDAGYKPTYGMGYTPFTQLAISNDGTAALRSSDGAVVGYDLSGCTTTIFIVGSSANTATGCRQRNLFASFAQQYSGFWSFSHMRFTDNKQIAGIVTGSTTLPGGQTVRVRSQAKYTVAGYHPTTGGYIALGDSFSSGEGAQTMASDEYLNGYIKGTDSDSPKNLCHLSPISYPYLAANELMIEDFHSVACSGAKYNPNYTSTRQSMPSEDSSQWTPGIVPQKDYLANQSPDTITLTMFGNDIGFADKIKYCLSHSDPCFHYKEERQGIAIEIALQFDNMVDMYQSVKGQDSNRKVYVLGYPRLFSDNGDNCGNNVFFDAEERAFANNMVSFLNATIKAATEKAGVQYIDVEHAFVGHELCSGADENDIAANGLTEGNGVNIWFIHTIGPFGQESYHPNQLGHRLLANALRVQSQNFTRTMPAKNYNAAAPNSSSNAYYDLIGNAPPLHEPISRRLIHFTEETGELVLRNAPITISAPISEALKPGSSVELWLNSTPTHLGNLTVDANGQVNGEVTVPAGIAPGYHMLHLYAKDIGGKDVDIYKVLYVAASENDIDGDGIPNEQEKCLAVDPANIDEDHDGIDDACDGQIALPPVPTDTTAPVVTGTPDRAPNATGWYNQDVTITWAATDADPSSGTPTQPVPTTAAQEGVHTYTSDQSCDPASNCATGSVEIKLDKTAPTITYSLSNNPNSNGWYSQDVTITFTCQDPLADQADPTSASGIASCPEPVTVQEDSSGQVLSGTATDNTGNTSATTVTINRDTTLPNITFSLDRQPNADGWVNGPVTVSFDCTDTISGIASCTRPVTVTQDGGSIVTGTAIDQAGNEQSINVFVFIDSALPQITATPTPAANQFVWNNTDVTVSFSCLDGLSGIASCSQPTTLTTEGDDLSATGSAADTAGNQATVVADGIRIDKTSPIVSGLSLSLPTKSTAATSTMTALLADTLSGIYRAEYFIGNTDPGEGNGATMPVTNTTDNGRAATASVTMGADFPTGVYKLSVRTQDYAGNWSAPTSDYLVVYDTDGPRLTGKKTLLPSLTNGDVLPGLTAATQQDRVIFGFNVHYGRDGRLSRNSDFQFSYAPRTDQCRYGHEHHHWRRTLQPCPRLELNATTIEWMTVDASTPHVATFQGTAQLEVNGQVTTVPFRVIATDGIRHDSTSPDHLRVLIFAAGTDPFTAAPVYHVDADVLRGNIRLR